MHPFRFGVISEHMTAPETWLQQVRRIEALGYSTLLMRDHFVPDFFGDQYAPLVTLMMAASVTTRLRLGTLVLDNDYRHPVMLAKEAATLDLLSGGRFELGIGAGWLRTEYEQAGLVFDTNSVRVSRLAESLQIIKGLFSDAPFSFTGEHYTIRQIDNYPKPAQRPHPPILVGAGKKHMLMLAGREADTVGILTTSVATGTLLAAPDERLAEAVAEKIEWIRQGAGDRFQQLELSLIPTLRFTDDRQQAAEDFIQQQEWSGISVEQVLAMPAVFIGTEDEIVTDMMRRREQYGFSYYVIGDAQLEALVPIVKRLTGL